MPSMCKSSCIKFCGFDYYSEKKGPIRESNPGPLAPKARIMPLDQQATLDIGRNGRLTDESRLIMADAASERETFVRELEEEVRSLHAR